MKTKIMICMGAALLCAGSATAQTAPTLKPVLKPVLKPLNVLLVEGEYAGSFLCSKGEMGMSLTLMESDPTKPLTYKDLGEEPCRSGAGPCNDRQNARFAEMHRLKGVLNFYPLLGNPDAPRGAFEVTGIMRPIITGMSRIEMSPGAWLEKPEGFGASGFEASLRKGVLSGKPTASGCSKLKMTKLRTGP